MADWPGSRQNLPVGVLQVPRRSRSDRCPDPGVEEPATCSSVCSTWWSGEVAPQMFARSPNRRCRSTQSAGAGHLRCPKKQRQEAKGFRTKADGPLFFGNSIGASPANNGEQHWKRAETVN